jgi:nucleotide sugar dehydrogenase
VATARVQDSTAVGVDGVAGPFAAITRRAEEHRARGGRVVAVQGLGFVGAAVAAVIAAATDEAGEPRYLVLGVDLPSPLGYSKVAMINAGVSPVGAVDPLLAAMTRKAAERGNLAATTCVEAYGLADVIVVDVHLDVETRVPEAPDAIRVGLGEFEDALRTIGRWMRPEALVVLETTVPLGATAEIALPILVEEREKRGLRGRPLLAHAYERVMPGPRYVESIRRYPRTFAGIDDVSAARTREFLSTFIDVDTHPLWELPDTTSSEMAKLLENSYRSMNIAFIAEWALLAERVGVNLFAVVDSIRVREGTHDNMRYPGFGVGGYCITKDSMLAQWGADHLFGADVVLGMTLEALRTNFFMPLHALDLLVEAVGDVEGKTIAVCGISYLPGVADTRNSPVEQLYDSLVEGGATVAVHDPHVGTWAERREVEVTQRLAGAVDGADAVVFAVADAAYLDLTTDELAAAVGRPAVMVDANNVVADDKAEDLVARGWRVTGVGKGHWRRRGFHV